MLVVLLWEVASGSDTTSDHKGTSKIELFGGCCSTNVKSSWNRQKNSSNLNQHGGEAKAKTSGWQGAEYYLSRRNQYLHLQVILPPPFAAGNLEDLETLWTGPWV